MGRSVRQRAVKSTAGKRSAVKRPPEVAKSPSGIRGLDDLTAGGLPRGRATLVCGGAGCGKTLFGMQFLVHGALEHGEPGVLISFEETEEEIHANFATLGIDIQSLARRKLLAIDHVHVARDELEDTGDYNLDGLFVRVEQAIESVGAKRIVLDTIETLLGAMPRPAIMRAEIRRLLRWLKDRGLTVVLTGERGATSLTRDGVEEYVSDCVILLDHRVSDQVSTRRLRVVKYRGSTHGTNEYPFLIDAGGISVLPVTTLGLQHAASTARISTGVPRLDEMMGGAGYYEGSTVLVSGTAGSGKTSLASHLAESTCGRGRRCLFHLYEESPAQVTRNLRSVGIDLERHVRSGRLQLVATRPYSLGLEAHLAELHRTVLTFAPDVVILDPITSLLAVGSEHETRAMMTRLIDMLKMRNITALFTSLTHGGGELEMSDVGVSSLIDTWVVLEVVKNGGERNRVLNIVKSRGMAHSNQASEYRLTDRGVTLLDTYVGPSGVLTGSARLAREAEDRREAAAAKAEIERLTTRRESRRKAFEGRLLALREEFANEDADVERAIEELRRSATETSAERVEMARARRAFTGGARASSRERT